MASLFDCFQPVFARGLRLEEEPAGGAGAGTVRRELQDLLAAARRCAEAERKPAADIERAAFAVVAWLDELVARNPDSVTGWTPLQVELFHTNNAGNEFFQHLRALGPDQGEALEVHYVALCLGFVGEHLFDPAELERIKREAVARLPVPPRPPRELVDRPITPQPYEVPLPRGPRLPRHWEKPALAAATALAVLVPLGLIAWFWWQRPAQVVEAPPPPLPPAAVDLHAEVERVARSFECADLDFSIGPDNAVLLSGFVGSEPDLAALQDQVRGIKDAGNVLAAGVEVQPYPFCEALLITGPLRERNQSEQLGLSLGVQGGLVLRDGQDLIVELTTPRYPPYLYLDYIQQDGWVGHVAHAPAAEPPDPAGDSFPFDTGYEIEPPFGREMMILVASPEPLFETPRPDEFERAEDYLPALRRRLEEARAQQPDLPLAASHVFIRTEPAAGQP